MHNFEVFSYKPYCVVRHETFEGKRQSPLCTVPNQAERAVLCLSHFLFPQRLIKVLRGNRTLVPRPLPRVRPPVANTASSPQTEGADGIADHRCGGGRDGRSGRFPCLPPSTSPPSLVVSPLPASYSCHRFVKVVPVRLRLNLRRD